MPISEFDGDRDKQNRYKAPHIPTAEENLAVLKMGESPKLQDRVDHFEGSLPLPTGLKKPKYAVPRWKGAFVEEK